MPFNRYITITVTVVFACVYPRLGDAQAGNTSSGTATVGDAIATQGSQASQEASAEDLPESITPYIWLYSYGGYATENAKYAKTFHAITPFMGDATNPGGTARTHIDDAWDLGMAATFGLRAQKEGFFADVGLCLNEYDQFSPAATKGMNATAVANLIYQKEWWSISIGRYYPIWTGVNFFNQNGVMSMALPFATYEGFPYHIKGELFGFYLALVRPPTSSSNSYWTDLILANTTSSGIPSLYQVTGKKVVIPKIVVGYNKGIGMISPLVYNIQLIFHTYTLDQAQAMGVIPDLTTGSMSQNSGNNIPNPINGRRITSWRITGNFNWSPSNWALLSHAYVGTNSWNLGFVTGTMSQVGYDWTRDTLDDTLSIGGNAGLGYKFDLRYFSIMPRGGFGGEYSQNDGWPGKSGFAYMAFAGLSFKYRLLNITPAVTYQNYKNAIDYTFSQSDSGWRLLYGVTFDAMF